LIVTVAVFPSAVPSFAVYVKVSLPVYPEAGVYVNDPSALRVRVPCAGSVTFIAVRGSLLASESFPRTPGAATVNVVSAVTV
jgi:hypothetical protein